MIVVTFWCSKRDLQTHCLLLAGTVPEMSRTKDLPFGWLGNPRTEWRFPARKNTDFYGSCSSQPCLMTQEGRSPLLDTDTSKISIKTWPLATFAEVKYPRSWHITGCVRPLPCDSGARLWALVTLGPSGFHRHGEGHGNKDISYPCLIPSIPIKK